MSNELFYRTMAFEPISEDIDSREITLSFSSTTPYPRRFVFSDGEVRVANEILKHDPACVDLSRLNSIGSVLFNHNPDIIIGPIKMAFLENGRGVATIKFDKDPESQKYYEKVQSGSLKGVSFGYIINERQEVMPGDTFEGVSGPAVIATRWSPYEITLTPIPADPNVGVGRELTIETKEVKTMPDTIEKVEVSATTGQMSVEMQREILTMAGAVSLELKARVMDMILDNKKAEEMMREIKLAMAAEVDATDKRGVDPGVKPENKIDRISDEEFTRMICSPVTVLYN